MTRHDNERTLTTTSESHPLTTHSGTPFRGSRPPLPDSDFFVGREVFELKLPSPLKFKSEGFCRGTETERNSGGEQSRPPYVIVYRVLK